ncbi:hypothetical protein MMC25_000867 [Agyrium rufum]|nr:hypothetical protein [Agyrium rufum]
MQRQAWGNPTVYNIPNYQANVASNSSTPRFDFVLQHQRARSVQASCVNDAMQREASYFSNNLPLVDDMFSNPWDDATKPHLNTNMDNLFAESFDMSFDTKVQNLSPETYDGANTAFAETVKLDDVDRWINNNPSSPDRQSLSSFSASSNEGISDFPDVNDLGSLSGFDNDLFEGWDLSFDPSNQGITSNVSTPIPASTVPTHNIVNSNLSIVRPSPMRRTTMPSHTSHEHSRHLSVPVLSSQQRASSEDNLFPALDYTHDNLMSDNIFGTNHTDMVDFQSHTLTPSHARHFSAADALFPNLASSYTPSAQLYKDIPSTNVLPSSAPFDLFHKHGNNCSHNSYPDLSPPPDLFASLKSPPLPPPSPDMNPSSPSMKPRQQELRFEGDLYTPQYVRGHGNKREGWCGTCKPGRWLVLKNSAYWYDKSFTHGVSAATGQPFDGPKEKRRMAGNPEVWEGLCGGCGDWIALVSSKRKGTTWFRHAYKCHIHQKPKDAPKRRRESISSTCTGNVGGGTSSVAHSRSSSRAGSCISSFSKVSSGSKRVKVDGGREDSPESLLDIKEEDDYEEVDDQRTANGRQDTSSSENSRGGVSALQTLSAII